MKIEDILHIVHLCKTKAQNVCFHPKRYFRAMALYISKIPIFQTNVSRCLNLPPALEDL